MLGINIAFKTPKNKFQELIYQFHMFSTHSNARFENKKAYTVKQLASVISFLLTAVFFFGFFLLSFNLMMFMDKAED